MPNLGPTELILILVIVIIVFGVGRLGDVGSAIGKAVRDFRGAVREDDTEKKEADKK
ncbi:MAG: twin-arginine translocase TatA/TatE family subunit [Chloroflexota bacterium]